MINPRIHMACVCALYLVSAGGLWAQEWVLVWSDEFNGSSLDRTQWEHEVNGWGGGNNELQYYTDRATNSFVENGSLVIQALEETYTGPDGTRSYTSARLRTLNRGDWTYGRYEVRARLPTGRGLWPAIWMLPTDWVYGGWAASGEIDIMEYLGHEPTRVYGTLHYGGEWPQNTSSGGSYVAPVGDFSDRFHTFAVEWEANEFRWYVDGVHYHTETGWYSSAAEFPAPFNQRFHLLLNVAVGGNWPGDPDASTTFPQRMEVDYVRVYERFSGPGTGTLRVQAEDYAPWGEGAGYHDTTPGNTGGAHRADDVDIEVTSDSGGGFNVGWIDPGEWLMYPVNIPVSGMYAVQVRTASPSGGGAFRIVHDAVDLTGEMSVPATGDWQNWTTVTRSNVFLTAGNQTLRFYVVHDGFNFNWFELVPPLPDQDTDGDGMPDTWELRYDGHPTNLVADVDGDLDGASNLDEYIADTNPTNAVSRLRMAGDWAESSMHLAITPASTGRVYSVQRWDDDEPGPDWNEIAGDLTPTGKWLLVTDDAPPPGGAKYRVEVDLPPNP